MDKPIQALGRELLSNNWIRVSQTDLCLVTGLPPWKISRLLKRFEIFRFVEVEEEPPFTLGRPEKLYKLTSSGIEYFTRLLGDDENSAESHAPLVLRGQAEGAGSEASEMRLSQYKSSGFSFKVLVVGSTSKPNDSRTTTPSKTLSMKSEIQTEVGVSFPLTFTIAGPFFTFTSPAPVITLSSPVASIPSSSASFFGKTVKLEPVSTRALTLVDFLRSKLEISTLTHEWPIPTTDDESGPERINSFSLSLGDVEFWSDEFRPAKPRRPYDVTVEEARLGGGWDE